MDANGATNGPEFTHAASIVKASGEVERGVPLSFLLLAGRNPVPPPPLANARVYIVRHAEKPEDGNGLTDAGVRRARAYVEYFRKDPVDGRPLRLTHLFAAKDSRKSLRPRLTAEPLAASLHKTVDVRFSDKEPEALVKALRNEAAGSRILIVWRHGAIPKLLKALGADPRTLVPEGKWPDDVYDRVIELRYGADGTLLPGMSRVLRERLMPGDSR